MFSPLSMRVLTILATLVGAGIVAFGCGGGQSSGRSASAPSASASAAPLQVVPSEGASPVKVSFTAGSCEMSVSDSLGSTYRFDPKASSVVGDVLKTAVNGCTGQPGGLHGIAHVQAHVDAGGKLSTVVVSPGGTLSTAFATCVQKKLEGSKGAVPVGGEAEALFFLVSSCKVAE